MVVPEATDCELDWYTAGHELLGSCPSYSTCNVELPLTDVVYEEMPISVGGPAWLEMAVTRYLLEEAV